MTEGTYDKRPAASDCISWGTIRDYQVLDDSKLIVTASGDRKFHVTLSRRATGLRSLWSIGFRSMTGPICASFGEMIVDDGTGLKKNRNIPGAKRC